MVEQKQQNWRKGPARHLLKLIQEGFQLMDAYISEDSNGKVIVPDSATGRVIKIHEAPPNYEEVFWTYNVVDEDLGQLGSFVKAGDIPRRDFERLVYQRNIFVKLCENKRQSQLGYQGEKQ